MPAVAKRKDDHIKVKQFLTDAKGHKPLRGRIGKCEEGCEGRDVEDCEGLCPVCCDVFSMVLAEEEKLEEDKEFNEVMEQLTRACEEDESGNYQKILNQSREGKVIH